MFPLPVFLHIYVYMWQEIRSCIYSVFISLLFYGYTFFLYAGGQTPLPPYSPEIYHLILVKLKIWDPKCLNVLLFLRWSAPPPFSKFLDPPLILHAALLLRCDFLVDYTEKQVSSFWSSSVWCQNFQSYNIVGRLFNVLSRISDWYGHVTSRRWSTQNLDVYFALRIKVIRVL
jgi:hypothetical protein